jgi:tetratricopeptide (TPR) repeat protein
MNRSIPVLVFILTVVVALSTVIIKLPHPRKERSNLRVIPKSRLSLRPYRYNREFDISSSEVNPEYTISDFLKRGSELLNQGSFRKAEDIFKTALLFDPDNAETIRSIGEIVFLDERYGEACNYFIQYLNLRPNTIEGYTNLAISYFSVNKFVAAETVIEQGLSRFEEENSGAFYFIHACIKQKLGDIKQAEALLFKSYDILGNDLLAIVNSKWSYTIKELPAYGKIQSIIDKSLLQ